MSDEVVTVGSTRSLVGILHRPEGKGPFPAIVLLHGCSGLWAKNGKPTPSYTFWAEYFRSRGFVALLLDSFGPRGEREICTQKSRAISESRDRPKDAYAALAWLEGRADICRGHVHLMGWSMGGGATWVDANTHPELRTAITLAGHIITATGGSAAITKIAVPTLMFAGQTDSAILGGGMSQPIYTQIPDSVPKMLYEISGAGHDAGNNPANNGKNVGLYGLSWQKVFLEGDTRYRQFLLVPGPNASDFRTNVK